jgi:hypothetical protein
MVRRTSECAYSICFRPESVRLARVPAVRAMAGHLAREAPAGSNLKVSEALLERTLATQKAVIDRDRYVYLIAESLQPDLDLPLCASIAVSASEIDAASAFRLWSAVPKQHSRTGLPARKQRCWRWRCLS